MTEELSVEYINVLVQRHKKSKEYFRQYNQEHKDKKRQQVKDSYLKMKSDPERYQKYLERKRKAQFKYNHRVTENVSAVE